MKTQLDKTAEHNIYTFIIVALMSFIVVIAIVSSL